MTYETDSFNKTGTVFDFYDKNQKAIDEGPNFDVYDQKTF